MSGSLVEKNPTMSLEPNRSFARNLSLAAHEKVEPKALNYPSTTKVIDNGGGMKQSGSFMMANLNTNLQGNRKLESQTANAQKRSPLRTTRDSSLTAQKLRRIPGKAEAVQVEDMPSDISEDEWGEIQRFGQRLHEEQMKKQKVAHESRVKQMREVLDQQVKLRNEIREKTLIEK